MSDSGERKKRANKLEKDLARMLDISRVPASGAIGHLKGDLVCKDYLIDSKNTEKNTISLTLVDLIKIYREGSQVNRRGHLILTFWEHDSHWAVVPERDLDGEFFVANIVANKSKSISHSYLLTNSKKASKKGLDLKVLVHFKTVPLGIPNKWSIISLKNYKETFIDVI